jgi:hypothetical protein
MASLAAGTALPMTAHQGLEAFTITNGAAVEAGTAFPTGTFAASPTGTYTKTANGFTLTMPSGRAATFAGSPPNQDFSAPVTGSSTVAEVTLTNGAASTLTYSTYGVWSEFASANAGIPNIFGTLVAGVATTTAQMPTTGTATYSGNIQGAGLTSSSAGLIRSGAVSLNANFASNTITGSVTGLVVNSIANENGPPGTMNNINLTGGTISGAAFSGTAAAAAATGTPLVNITGATGTFGGKFFGPAAAEAGGSLALTGPGGINVIASFGTKKN